jgi:hypothetical protein
MYRYGVSNLHRKVLGVYEYSDGRVVGRGTNSVVF